MSLVKIILILSPEFLCCLAPLAIELVTATGGDDSLTVVLVVVTGIVAVLLKDHLFKLMRVSDNDTLTIGST